MESSSSSSPLKIYFIPFLTPSHMVPLFELSRLFVARGHHVTILTTPSNARSLQSSAVSDHSHLLRFQCVQFPSREVGLPDGLENLFQATDFDSVLKFFQAFGILQQRMEDFMESDPPIALYLTPSSPGPPTSPTDCKFPGWFSTDTLFLPSL
ncbi:UDP-glycosyltransferase 73B4-like [Neltuma alba]|uniref:UDP-glycosyltransferase 73B4-like n=1 Tax=Neltuma alba TaxID=207710 RepID=UPI0010A3CE7A|nr:UDP-glycosyltransferase 73B4-like [Prosopis alba]